MPVSAAGKDECSSTDLHQLKVCDLLPFPSQSASPWYLWENGYWPKNQQNETLGNKERKEDLRIKIFLLQMSCIWYDPFLFNLGSSNFSDGISSF